MFDLSGKTALVTGGSRGIGKAAAQILARQGARVILTYVRDAEAAQRTVEAIEASGGRAEAEKIDTADFDATEAAVSALAKRAGALDILVANAGISVDALLLRLKSSDLDSILNVNLKGALACAQAAIKPMMRARGGRIIFLSSVVGQAGNAGQVAYAASKAALIGAAKSLAREYASRNITVNAVAPGYVETDMTAALEPKQREAMLAGVPLGRPASAEEIGAAIAFIASPEAAYITGQVLAVNGGMYM
ncbi:MAG TPA: 3-oxoacyl-ACP reductase FabG [Polyangiaceae bacterium]|nr:3-oxoacyl-ACP reductase FabG [Polyangiaceae bacterium]